MQYCFKTDLRLQSNYGCYKTIVMHKNRSEASKNTDVSNRFDALKQYWHFQTTLMLQYKFDASDLLKFVNDTDKCKKY